MRNPFRRKALTATAEVVAAVRDGWAPWPLLGSGSRERILGIFNAAQSADYTWRYTHSPAVRSVVDTIVRNVGQLELRLYEQVSESERQPRPDHPAALSLRYPDERVSADGLIRQLVKDWLIHDNAYALLNPGVNRQISLTRMPAYMVVVQGESLFNTDNYRVWPQGAWTSTGSWGGAGRFFDIPPENMAHWHGEHPLDPRIGISRLDTLRDVIAEDAALAAATVELAQNGLQEPAWVFRPLDAPQWSNQARTGFEEDLTNRMRKRNATPLVLEEGMEMRSFGISPRDAQMYEIRRWAIERVAAEYGMPLGMVGLAPDITEARSQFLADVLTPLCEDFCRFLDHRILVRLFDWPDGRFGFAIDEKYAGDERLKTFTSATGRPVMLTNEARAKLNLPPVDGGDELVTPLNVIVGEKPSPQLMPVQDPNKPPQDGSYRPDQGPTPIESGAPPGKTVLELQAKADQYEPLPQLLPRRAAELERQNRAIDAMQAVLQGHVNRLARALHIKATLEWGRWDRELATDLNKALSAVVQAEGDVYMVKLAAPSSFDMSQVAHYLAAMAQGAAGAINDTIRGEVRQHGAAGAVSRAGRHVESAGTSLGAKATQWAREQAARQAPDAERRVKMWIADSTRHQELDGQTVALEADWPGGFAPGGVPGCRCTSSVV